MRQRRNQNLIWLFSFADLAFLLLIAFTQASTIGKKPISIGEMTLPRVVDSPSVELMSREVRLYQVRVHKPSEEGVGPFQLVMVMTDGVEHPGDRLSEQGLKVVLTALEAEGAGRPVLVPDEASLSKDMLMAMSLIEKVWKDTRTVTVERITTLEEGRP
ncbi:hypothetical protein [Desulfosudis oleivorans]|uniref:Biopolymer transporter ExbD n=1 Tax=Desulfosudis oleivorans (strain DSM 6200 / JCM 39069 / Hxd3) TaxID=96561 RepID=A8ZY35_DESOH|nr:hypothetical protein [Desulfosudis oleivorans]ABW67042.1 conserved hypothetical protein [Desulfosudis oleivorans Hxd3]